MTSSSNTQIPQQIFQTSILSKLADLLVPLPSAAIQESIVAELEAEQALVEASRLLVERMEAKIRAAIGRVWGQGATLTNKDGRAESRKPGKSCVLSEQIQSENRELVMTRQLTAIIEREGKGYIALCPELDIASQGDTVDEARNNLKEALELFFETASASEVQRRLHDEVYVTRVEIAVG